MNRLPIHLAVLLSLIAFSGGGAAAQSAAASAEPAPAPILVDGHESEEVWIVTGQGRYRFTAEIADEPVEQSTGLMFRQKMPADHGMLFDFGETRQVTMWMRNTPLPLDMVFIAPDGTVTRIAERTTPFSDAIIPSEGAVSHVLELNAGISRLIGLKPGDRVEHASLRP